MARAIRPVVLCGGSGTRLWPLSTAEHPKQFLKLLGERAMLEMTIDRVSKSSEDGLAFSRPLVIGSARHAELVERFAPGADILLEPQGRNSAAPVAAAALASAPDDLILILPADHMIGDVPAFHKAIASGAAAAESGAIVTFGIVAEHPATGYGYIEADGTEGAVLDVRRFVEKPDLETAKTYVASGNFFWNAGIFLFRASNMLAAFEAHAPDILTSVRAAMPASGESGRAQTFEADRFAECRAESVDYAIIEHHKDLKTVPVDMGWSDIGDFKALWEQSKKDENGNVVVGNATLVDCRNCYVRSEGPAISIAGEENSVVVATMGETLVCDMASVQTVKSFAGK